MVKKTAELPLQYANAQKNSIKFYQKLGWQTIGDFFTEAGVLHKTVIFIPKEGKIIKSYKCLKDEKCPKAIKICLKKVMN